MYMMKLVFEINYGDMFDKKYRCIYVGGEMDVHPDNVNPDSLTFFSTRVYCGTIWIQSK